MFSILLFQGILSLINSVSLLIILFSLEKNLRMNWIIKSELNLFSILLFLCLCGLMLQQVIFVWSIGAGFFTGNIQNFVRIRTNMPSDIINLAMSFTLLCTASVMLFKNVKIFLVNKSGKIWFKILKK